MKKISFVKSILPLVPVVPPKDEETKRSVITMELKSQAGIAQSGSYKKKIFLLMKEHLRSGLMPRGISLKSGGRIVLQPQKIEYLLSRL